MKRTIKQAAYVGLITIISGIAVFGAQNQAGRLEKPGNPLPNREEIKMDRDGTPTPGSNSITARIQTDLDSVKKKIDAAVKSLQEAVVSNEAQRASSVSNVAAQIRILASSDLGDGSALVKETDKLIAKMRAQINQGRMLSADPKEEARESYAQGLLTLEPELSRLIDRRTAVARVRSELQRQANVLESRARAIAWLEDADQMKVASKALEEALSEALAFAGRIDSLIGQGSKLAVE
jgi:hypothetical protein